MKKITLLLLLALSANLSWVYCQNINSQGNLGIKQLPQSKHKSQLATPALTGFEEYLPGLNTQAHPIAQDRDLEELVGKTYYDLQTNGAMPDRIVLRTDGSVSAAYTVGGSAATNFAGRGTKHNHKPAGGAFASPDTVRIESVRTGFTNLALLANGTEVTVAHSGAGDPIVMTKANGATSFSQQTVATPRGCFWYRMTSGGADGNSIHMIAVTTPIANGGTAYEGVNGKLLYWRSTDGGTTWDKTGASFAELDSTVFKSTAADSYVMDADGDHIVIAIFSGWNDSVILESMDNGNTWTKKIIFDFPLDNYVTNAGYTLDQIPPTPFTDPQVDGADSSQFYAIETTDGSGDVIIGFDGTVHAFFGLGRVVDWTLTDDGTNFYPGINGLVYWNSVTEELTIITGALDLNGNDSLDIADVVSYRGATLASMPTVGFDENGNMILVYASVVEGLAESESNDAYRHLYAMRSEDSGETWSDPVDLINLETIGDEFLVTVTEAVFPSVAKDMDENLHVVYMSDNNPLTYVNSLSAGQPAHPAISSDIKYITKNIQDLFTVSTTELGNPTYDVSVAPNPATDVLRIAIKSDNQFDGQLQLINQLGQVVVSQNAKFTGNFAHTLPVNTLAKGMYFLRVSNFDGSSSVVKLMING